MRKPFLFTSLMLGSLLLASPVFAVSYSGSASVDWSTLTFSGIHVVDLQDSFGPRLQGHAANLVSSSPPDYPGQLTAFGAGFHTQWNNSLDLSITLPDPTIPGSSWQLGTGSSIADGSNLTASVHMVGPGLIVSEITRFGWFSAVETGNLNMTIAYKLTHDGVPSLQNGFASTATAELGFRTLDGTGVSSKTTLASSSGPPQTGILSVSRLFQAGEIFSYGAGAGMRTVPIPDMLWPTLVGMIGIALWWERRRCQQRLAG